MRQFWLVCNRLVLCCVVLSFSSTLSALPTQRFGDSWKLNVSPDLRLSYQRANNTGDLKGNEGDSLEYGSYIYNLPISIQYGTMFRFFTKITGEGPSHYAAPLKDLTTSVEGANVNRNGSGDSVFYPWLAEAWIQLYTTPNHSLQVGQSPYKVGNGYALGGQYNHYGLTYLYEKGRNNVRLRYSLLDRENAYSEIRKKTNSKWLGRSADSDAYMIAADILFQPVKRKSFSLTFQPYGGFLHDQTPLESRAQPGYFANIKTTVVGGTAVYTYQPYKAKLDEILTYGLSTTFDSPYLTVNLEYAKNGGKTTGQENNQNWGDITHSGYLFHSEVKAHAGMFTPRAKLVLASGNEVNTTDPTNYYNATLKRNENKAFSVFSPLNTNLVDSHAHGAPVPVVAMAGGYTMNYGIRRPGTFNDPHVWENLSAYDFGLNIVPHSKVFLMTDFWILKAMNAAIGQDSSNTIKQLSKDLGSEIDFYATYSITHSLSVGAHGGLFMPGDYYKTVRTDLQGDRNGEISQTVRADGSAENAHQVEFFVTYKF